MSEKNWFFWARKMMLLLGSALLLAGIIFFFAYNWDSMRPFQKLSLLEFGVVACAVAAYLTGLSKLTGKILLLAAVVISGVLLAVYGQIYQTGADTYELFSLWAILIFGWVIVAKFDVLWLVWLIILNIALFFYWSQIVQPVYHYYDSLNIALACLNGTALIFYTAAVRCGVKWLKSKWLGKILLLTVLVILSIPTIDLISRTFYPSIPTQIATLMWSAVIISGYFIYRYKFRDMLAIAMIITNACVILLTMIWKWLDVDMIALDGNSYNKYLMFSVIILIIAGATIYLLRKTAAIISKEKNTADCSFEEKNTLTKEPVYLRFISGSAAWFAAGFIIAAFGLFLFENEKIAKLNNVDFIEYIELHSSEKRLRLRNGVIEHFKVVVSPIEGSLNSFISFINTEVVSQEIERLKAHIKLDTLTQLYTREIFMQDIEQFLDSETEYYALCFGLKHLKEFIKLFGVSSPRDIYKTLGVNLKNYFSDEVEKSLVSLYYFDTNHFVAVVASTKCQDVKDMLKEFGVKYDYTNKLAKTYEPMYLDVLDLKLNDSMTSKSNIAEIENKLYMLNLDAF